MYPEKVFQTWDIELDFVSQEVFVDGKKVPLNYEQTRSLRQLIANGSPLYIEVNSEDGVDKELHVHELLDDDAKIFSIDDVVREIQKLSEGDYVLLEIVWEGETGMNYWTWGVARTWWDRGGLQWVLNNLKIPIDVSGVDEIQIRLEDPLPI